MGTGGSDSDQADSPVPVVLPNSQYTVQRIALGELSAYAIALDDQGARKIITWGKNTYGQLLNGGFNDTLSPAVAIEPQQTLIDAAIDIQAKGNAGIIVTPGTLYTFGAGVSGLSNLGRGEPPASFMQLSLGQIGTLFQGQIITAMVSHSRGIAITDAAMIYTWGKNDDANAAIGIETQVIYTPKSPITDAVLAGKDIIAISTGGFNNLMDFSTSTPFTVVLTSEGMLYSWGDNTVCSLCYSNK